MDCLHSGSGESWGRSLLDQLSKQKEPSTHPCPRPAHRERGSHLPAGILALAQRDTASLQPQPDDAFPRQVHSAAATGSFPLQRWAGRPLPYLTLLHRLHVQVPETMHRLFDYSMEIRRLAVPHPSLFCDQSKHSLFYRRSHSAHAGQALIAAASVDPPTIATSSLYG